MSAHPFESRIRDVLPDLERIYTDIHAHPELSMQETRTAGLAADRLRAAGFEVTPGVGKTGVVGMLRNGDGPTVMLRADMDALPVRGETGLPYASVDTATDATGKRVPVMHACGHDMHVAWLIGAATVLTQTRDTWKGTLIAEPFRSAPRVAVHPLRDSIPGGEDPVERHTDDRVVGGLRGRWNSIRWWPTMTPRTRSPGRRRPFPISSWSKVPVAVRTR